MSGLNIQRVGQIEGTLAILAYNRSGATLERGAIMMLDVLGTASETTSIVEGDEASVFANLTKPATAGLPSFPMYVLDEESVEDNKLARWVGKGLVKAQVQDDATATTDVDRGDGVTVLNAATALEATTTGNRRMGLALEDAAATGGASLKSVMWWGGDWGAGVLQQT